MSLSAAQIQRLARQAAQNAWTEHARRGTRPPAYPEHSRWLALGDALHTDGEAAAMDAATQRLFVCAYERELHVLTTSADLWLRQGGGR